MFEAICPIKALILILLVIRPKTSAISDSVIEGAEGRKRQLELPRYNPAI
jgi:hypothetical protein